MKATFDDSGRLSRPTIADFRRLDDRPALVRLSVQVILLCGLCVATSGGWSLALAGMLGIVTASLFAPLHECTHRTAFRSRRLNQTVATAAGLALLSA